MKFLVAIALLVLAVAEAHHVREHTLRGPRFLAGHTYTYDAVFNVTAGVLGLSSQVSASVLRADVKIHAKSETEHILKIENVRASGSVSAIEHTFGDFDDINLEGQRELEDKLSSPIKFTLQDGKVTKYTLSRKDNLESTKIKRSILRSLEMEIPGYILQKMEKLQLANQPIMYNRTENTDYGVHISNYIITASPDVEYPQDTVVYNISRIDNCEGEWYPGYHLHHNFQMQGCPEVCRPSGEWQDNFYRAGCPTGFEPHHSPIKRTFNHEHSLSFVKDTLTPEMITTIEVHFANMYDQDMEVLIRYHLHRTGVSQESFDVESGQTTYDDLHKEDLEITEDEIDQICDYKTSKESVRSAKELLQEVSDLIVKAEPGSPVGEKIILLRNALARFTLADFQEVAKEITELEKLQQQNSDTKSVARQVWLEILPLVGTTESVKFIVKYIKDEMRKDNMLIWEAKEMMESLPQNIERPEEEIITEMAKLLDDEELLSKSNLLHSAVHLTMGRIIGRVCGNAPVLRQEEENEKRSWLLRSHQKESTEFRGPPKCPTRAVLSIIEGISRKLKGTDRPEKMAIYVEALTHTGMEEAFEYITDYAYGTAQNMRHLSPKHLSFMKSIVIHALHNMAGRHPQQVMEIVLPMYFNYTETPKLRNAAFGTMMRCQPSLALLQRVATHSWFEMSQEVGSFVTSTLESFGNSTLPCMQLLSHRIKEILPQVRRFKIGVHHAKNHMWTYYDDLRRFGLEGRFEYTPSNESIIPSTFYHALTYTFDSLRDTVFQGSLNIEGLTQEMLWKRLIRYMDMPNIEPISRESEIFGKGEEGMDFMQPRTAEDLRMVTYHKLFYKSSYNYLNTTGIRYAMKEFAEIFEKYLRKTSKYSGHLVKLFLPSTYHTIAVAKTLPYPVEFQMRQPIVISLAVKTADSMRTKPTVNRFDLHLKPSIHMSKVFTHHMKNMRDCKEVGVYHTHKIAMTFPFQIRYDGAKFPNVVFKYRIPERERKVLYYYTESGTYAGKKELKALPLDGAREPITTLPTPFKFVKDVSLVGLPPFHIELETEDMNLFHQRMPRTPTEALHLAVKNILNAGWRYKSANITLVENRAQWTRDSEATFEVEYSRNHVVRTRRSRMSPQDEPDSSVAQPPKKNYGSSVWQRQIINKRQNSRQSDDVTETSWWRSTVRQSEDDEWNTESPNLKQWEDDDSNTYRHNLSPWHPKKSRQSEDDDWNKELPLRQSEDDDWNKELPLRQSEDDDWNKELPLRQSEDDDWNRELPLRQSEDDDSRTLWQSGDDDWSRYMKPTEHESFSDFSKNAKAVSRMMTTILPHINHRLKISISAEPLSSTAYLLMDYNHTYDKFLNVLRLQAVSKRANNERPYEVDVNHVIGYFNQPDELHYDDGFKGQRSVFRTAINWPKGRESERPWEKMNIFVLGEMHYESNRDLISKQLKERVGEEYFLPETHEECKRDVQDERPLSINCIKAIREHSAFNRINMAIQWSEDLPECYKHVARVADIYLKHYFFEHLYFKAEENEPRRIDIATEYIDKFVDMPVANWEIKKPSETVILKQIPIENAQPFSSMYPMYEAALLKVTNNTYPARCVLSDSYVQTYDLVTYPFKPENCHYVLSSHCTKNKNFAIILRGSGRNKEIHIHVASTRIVLLPTRDSTRGFQIKNGREDVTVLSPVILNEQHDIYAYLERHQSDRHLRVIAKKAGINVLYDGRTVKIQVSPRYKGELCGLCSEFDGEEVREFRGMDRCLYTDHIDFANSNLVKRSGNCAVRQHRGQRMCEESKFEDWNKHSAPTTDGDEPRLQRNVVIYRGDEVCFSVRPVPACPEDVEPTETETQRIGFHCLPKDDLTAQKLITEAAWRTLDELRRKSVDHVQEVEVPRRC